MKFQGCKRPSHPKWGWILLCFIICVLMIYTMNILEFQNKVKTIIVFSRPVTPLADTHHDLCKLRPLPPKEAREEDLLLESIAWPETPPLPSPFSLNTTSDPAHSTFTILPQKGGGQWHVGDKLVVLIKINDFQGHSKKSGGDVLFARLHSPTLGAGVVGKVVDHLNGSYTAVFVLLWAGSAQVQVTLVHPSEAVTELRRLNRVHPDRILFKSVFQSHSVNETTICNICLRPTQQPVCNYTDLRTGEPWFCYKPENLSCDARINNFNGGNKPVTATEKLFQSGVNLKVSIPASGPASVTIFPKKKEEAGKMRQREGGQSDAKSSSAEAGPSGYYYQGAWRALGGATVHQFNTSSAITRCLKGKMVHMYGDSTMRQWFEHLKAKLPGLKVFDLHSKKQAGPFMALDYKNNIMMMYRCHGPPLRSTDVPAIELHYVANELENMAGGSNTVVALSVWAHFGTFPIEFYIRRLLTIRRAVVRLLDRAPTTLVVIRTGNPKSLTTFVQSSTNSDWYSLQQVGVLKAMFRGLNVHLVDAWEMVLAHHLPQELHPQPPILQNMINVLLSYICPEKSN